MFILHSEKMTKNEITLKSFEFCSLRSKMGSVLSKTNEDNTNRITNTNIACACFNGKTATNNSYVKNSDKI